MNFSVVIPTYDRLNDLKECLNSIVNQSLLPKEIIIIDDGNLKKTFLQKVEKSLKDKAIKFQYFKKEIPGLAKSKNLGAKEARGDIVLFLDDDVILEKDYLENLVKVWKENEKDKRLAGVSGIVINFRKKSWFERIFNRFFCLYSPKPRRILPWGFYTWDNNFKKPEKADLVFGGISSFRKEIFKKYQFKPLQPGRTALENLEFCWRIKKDGYYFIVTPFAKLIHNESQINREEAILSGYKEGFNRWLIFKLHAQKTFKNYLCFGIASLGWIIRQWLAIFIEPKLALNHFLYGIGLMKGNLDFLIHHFIRIKNANT